MKSTPLPQIICMSGKDDDTFQWMSGGWYSAENRHTEQAKEWMAIAKKAIAAGENVTEVIKSLEDSGFEVLYKR